MSPVNIARLTPSLTLAAAGECGGTGLMWHSGYTAHKPPVRPAHNETLEGDTDCLT